MIHTNKYFTEKNFHRIFVITLVIKGIFAFFEIIGGIFVFFIPQDFLINFIQNITEGALVKDPRDYIANHLRQWAEDFSISSQYFVGFYLLSHGAIKLWLIYGLLRNRLWYYKTSMIVFGLFILYQIYRFSFTHSIILIFLIILDLVVIWLTWHEYRFLRRQVRP